MSTAKKKTTRKSTRRTTPAPKPTAIAQHKPWTKAEGRAFMRWFNAEEERDKTILKLTRWSDDAYPRYGIKTLGDLFMSAAGLSMGDPKSHLSLMMLFNTFATEVDTMAELELHRRTERQKSNLHEGKRDLYGQLHNLAQRLRAMGELLPRIMKANYETTSDGQPVTFRTGTAK